MNGLNDWIRKYGPAPMDKPTPMDRAKDRATEKPSAPMPKVKRIGGEIPLRGDIEDTTISADSPLFHGDEKEAMFNPDEAKKMFIEKAKGNPKIYDPSGKFGVEVKARKYANRLAAERVRSGEAEDWETEKNRIMEQLISDPSQVAEGLAFLNPSTLEEDDVGIGEVEGGDEPAVPAQLEETQMTRRRDAEDAAYAAAGEKKREREEEAAAAAAAAERQAAESELFDEEGGLRQERPFRTKPWMPPRDDPSGSEEQTAVDTEEAAAMPEMEPGQKRLTDFGKGFGAPSLGEYLLKATVDRMYQDL